MRFCYSYAIFISKMSNQGLLTYKMEGKPPRSPLVPPTKSPPPPQEKSFFPKFIQKKQRRAVIVMFYLLSLFNEIDLNCYVSLPLSNDKLLYLKLYFSFFLSFISNTSS